jgi:soluble lytic murein transglycosylase-like protein
MRPARCLTDLRVLAGALLLAALAPGAAAQIYVGTDRDGVVTLSTAATDVTPTMLLGDAPAVKEPPGRRPRASAFLEQVSSASAATGVPRALIEAVIQVESNFDPAARSLKGAVGLMQVMPATGRRFGAKDLNDPADNILVGSRYLKYLLESFDQDVELALAAYNAGEGAVLRAGRRTPKIAETARYVPKVLDTYRALQAR